MVCKRWKSADRTGAERLLKWKELKSLDINQRLTEELKKQILAEETLVAVEDLYRPYRPKRRTRATIAKEKGLEPLAALDHIVEDKGTV